MKKLISNLIIILIYLTPFFGVNEVCNFLLIESPLPIIYYKAVKEVLLISLLTCTCFLLVQVKYPRLLSILLQILLLFTVLSFILSYSNTLTALAGLRWAIPFFLAFLLLNVVDNNLLKKITTALSVIIFLNLVVQVYEMYNMPAIRGLNLFGLSGRVSGFYANASIAGVFGCFSFFFIRYFGSYRERVKFFLYLICAASIFLSMSSAAFAILAVMLAAPYFLRSRFKLTWLLIFIPACAILALNLDFLTGRHEGSSNVSFSTRLKIFGKQIEGLELLSTRFGEATNTAVNLNRHSLASGSAYISDSLFTSILTNYGLLFFMTFFVLVIVLSVKIMRKDKTDLTIFFIISLMSSISMITVEIFPISLLMSLLIAYYLSPLPISNLSYRTFNVHNMTNK